MILIFICIVYVNFMSPIIIPDSEAIAHSSSASINTNSNSNNSKKSWDHVNREAKILESELDTKLLGLSRLTSSALRSGRASSFQSEAEAATVEIESGLQRLATLIEELNLLVNSAIQQPDLPPQHSATHLIQRHRDIHMEYVKELRKARMHLAACLQPSNAARPPNNGAMDYLLNEADRISNLGGITDHIIKYQSEHPLIHNCV
jgi:hypothetical protein